MNSVQEGASKGVPMIMIPIFADQPSNAKKLESRGMAIALNRNTLTVDQLTAAIKKIISDQSYRQNAKRISSMIAAKPTTAEERIVKYTEFAAKFGPDLNLDMYGRHLGFLEYYCLDIIIPALVVVSLVLFVIFRLVRKLLSLVFSFVLPQKTKKE